MTRTRPIELDFSEAGTQRIPTTLLQEILTRLAALESGGGGGGGGITNSAGNNVVMKSNGTNAVASNITDDGTTIDLTKSTRIGFSTGANLSMAFPVNPSINGEIFAMTLTNTNTPWVVANGDTFGIVVRNQTVYDTTTGANKAGGGHFEVTASKSAGSNTLTNAAVQARASGGDVNVAIWALQGTTKLDDLLEVNGASTFSAAVTCTSTLGVTGAVTLQDDLTVGTGAGHDLVVADKITSGLGPLRVNKNRVSSGTDSIIMGWGSGGTGKNWSFYASSNDLRLYEYDGTVETPGSGNDRLTFQAGGNIGIGTTIPNTKLEVNGTATATDYRVGSSTGPRIRSGNGSPNSVVTGSPGDIYINTAGGASTTLYVKESGSDTNTGWVGK